MAWNTATDRVLAYELEMFGDWDGGTRRVMKGDHEFYVVVLVQARSLTGAISAMDVSSASSATLVLIQPDGIEVRKTMSDRTDGSDGYVQYQIDADDITMGGRWRLRVEVAWSTAVTSTAHGQLDILEHGKGSTSGIPMTTNPGSLTASNRARSQAVSAGGALSGKVSLVDGITAPTEVLGEGQIYIDSADGNLKIRFGDGTITTIATD